MKSTILGFAAVTGVLMGLMGCATAPAPAMAVQEPPASANGRYAFSHDARDVFITDTATGTVWYRSFAPRDDKWNPLGSPLPTTKP